MNDTQTLQATAPACAPMIFRKIADCLNDVDAVGKNHRNQQQNYAFRSIDDFYDAMQPVLAKHRIFVAPTILEHSREERQTKSGSVLMTTLTKVRYRIYAEDGSFIEADALGEGADSGDKSANKAAATAMKYLFMQVFAVRVNGESHDSEREHHSYAPSATQPVKTPPRPAQAAKRATPVDVLPKAATEKTRDRMWELLVQGFNESEIAEWATAKGFIVDGIWKLEHVPTTKDGLNLLISDIGRWLEGGEPAPAEDGLPAEIANVKIHIPPAGTKKADYVPQTIGELYARRHDDESARNRLFGFMEKFQPKGWEKRDGTTMPPSEDDIRLREALDKLAELIAAKEGK